MAVDEGALVVPKIEAVEAWGWTPTKWAAHHPDAQHEYVMAFDVPEAEYVAFVRQIRAEGYKGRWGPNPVTGKSYSNRYLELGEWTYWWIPRCLNREHNDSPTLRRPASLAESEQQLTLG